MAESIVSATSTLPREVLVVPPVVPPENLTDIFNRQDRMPGDRRDILGQARILAVGAGGLNSWVTIALLRSGARHITVVDPDIVELTNLPRQFYFACDAGQSKATALIHNCVGHALAGARLTSIPLSFEEASRQLDLAADIIVCGVDSNPCRLACVREARRRRIPAILTMLSEDGMFCQSFLQGGNPNDACLWCAVPHLDPELVLPCVPAGITGCLLACAHAVNFVHRALMGWPVRVQPFNWREADLLGRYPDRTGTVPRRPDCPICQATA